MFCLCMVAWIMWIIGLKTYFQSLYVIIEYMQFLMLLPIIADFPQDVRDYVSHLSYTLFSFRFIHLYDMLCIKDFISTNKHAQNNAFLEDIGLKSANAFINLGPLLFIFGIISLFHSTILLIKLRNKKQAQNESLWSKLVVKINDFLTFGFYIRIFLCSQTFILLWIFTEINELNFNTARNIISFILNLLLLGAYVAYVVLKFIALYLKAGFSIQINKYGKFKELFIGLKDARIIMYYEVLKISKLWIMLFIWWFWSFMPSMIRCIIIVILQTAYTTMVSFIRPFYALIDNIILIFLESNFLVMSSALVYFKDDEKWTDSYKWIFMVNVLVTLWTWGCIKTINLIYHGTYKQNDNLSSTQSAKTSPEKATRNKTDAAKQQEFDNVLQRENSFLGHDSRLESNNSLFASNHLEIEGERDDANLKNSFSNISNNTFQKLKDRHSVSERSNVNFDFHPQAAKNAKKLDGHIL